MPRERNVSPRVAASVPKFLPMGKSIDDVAAHTYKTD